MAPRQGASGSYSSRDKVLVVFFLAAIVGMGLSFSTLQASRSKRFITQAREDSEAEATKVAAQIADLQKKADDASAARTAAESTRETLQKEVEALKAEAARGTSQHAEAIITTKNMAEASAATQRKEVERQRDIALQEVRDVKTKAENLQSEVVDLKTRLGKRGAGGNVTVSPDDGRHTPLQPSAERDLLEPDLAAFLRKVAINGEVLATLSNINYGAKGGMLDTWMEGVKRCGVKNAMVIALDAQTKANAEAFGIPAFEMHLEISKSQGGKVSNHAVSSLKFRVLRHFLRLGYAVFLSDVDIVTLQNPFPYLVRDSDVEGMSDGFDNGTAYGYNDVLDDASMGCGLFYIRPTPTSLDLLDRLVHRVETENGWDQAIFNEVIYFPSRPGFTDPHVHRRVLDYLLFMNSKVLFKTVRKDVGRFGKHMPVMIHVNYHPDKHPRMLAIVERYVKGDMKALDRFPDGSE